MTNTMTDNAKPLADVRVLAVESYGAGPWATLQLADMGAEIVKIEQPGVGDISREVPPGAGDGDSLFFQSFNRGKKSITLDIRSKEGRDVFNRLLPSFDVLFANPKGTMPEKMGLTYEHLKAYNPGLVCCFLTGYGRSGPKATLPGYDYLIQALSGIAWMGGEPDGPPTRCGVSVIDMAAGTNAAMIILAAVHQARATGKGCTVDTSLLEIAVSFLNYLACWTLTAGFEPRRMPMGAHQTIVPSQFFHTSDGYIMVMAQQDKFYLALVKAIGLPELGEDPRFFTMQDRYENREILIDALENIFKTKSTAEWVLLLEGKVPVAPVNTISQALKEPQLDALGMIIEYDHPKMGKIRQAGPPFIFGRGRPDFSPAPPMGADTERILTEYAGVEADEIAALRRKGII